MDYKNWDMRPPLSAKMVVAPIFLFHIVTDKSIGLFIWGQTKSVAGRKVIELRLLRFDELVIPCNHILGDIYTEFHKAKHKVVLVKSNSSK